MSYWKEDVRYAFCKELEDVIALLLEGPYELDKSQLEQVHNFHVAGRALGYLDLEQMSALGTISKEHIQNGEYVHHDWWDGTIQAIRFYKRDQHIVDQIVLVKGTEQHDGIYTVEDEVAAVLAGNIADTIDGEIVESLSASEFRRRFDAKLAERKESK